VAVVDRAREQLAQAIVRGDEEHCRRIVFDLYLAGHSACEICDNVLAATFHTIGDRWECGDLSVYRERRACEIGSKLLHELRAALPSCPATAPLALGGTLTADPYQLPTSMIELVLREQGWQATSLGTRLPATTMAEALRDTHPRLLWLSVSAIVDESAFLHEYALLQAAAQECGTAIVVGGRALIPQLRRQMVYSAYCDQLRHLITFAATLTGPHVS
jgi:methanogenic corrinoid protein MtbC1